MERKTARLILVGVLIAALALLGLVPRTARAQAKEQFLPAIFYWVNMNDQRLKQFGAESFMPRLATSCADQEGAGCALHAPRRHQVGCDN